MKEHQPISLAELFEPGYTSLSPAMIIPEHGLEITKHNFAYNGSDIWNRLIGNLDTCQSNESNIMVPGPSRLYASISEFKNRLKNHQLHFQQIKTPGRPNEWMPNISWVPQLRS